MREAKKLKICFIAPEVAQDTATHFLHKYELMDAIKDKADFFVIQPTFAGIVRMKFAYFFRGYRTFYAHYSFKGALLAIILTSIFGGRVFYWNCGMPWLYRRGRLEEKLFLFILRHAIFVTGTEGLAAEYIARYGIKNPVRVVPNAIDVSRFQKISKEDARKKLGIPQDKKIVLFLHRLSRRKGAHLLPEIIRKFADMEDILFVVVGDGPERKNIEFQVSSFRIQDRVRFEDSVPNHRVPYYIAAADVYLMPSEEEGMPNALLEAMAAGVPFVASDVAAVREMTPPAMREFVLPYGDINIFAEKIKKLLADEELRKRISTEEQEWMRRYDVSAVAPVFLELIKKAILR